MARPTKYKKEFIQELLDYLDVKPYEEITKKIVKDGQEIEITEKIVADYPSLAGFAVKIGVCRDTITEWAKIYPEFSGACKRLNVVQENYLIVNGLKGNIQQNFGMFVAKITLVIETNSQAKKISKSQ